MLEEDIENAIERAEMNHERLKDMVHDQYDEIEKLKERIGKAIKYIEEHSLYEQDYDFDYEENLVEYPPSDEQTKKDLLAILKGSESNE